MKERRLHFRLPKKLLVFLIIVAVVAVFLLFDVIRMTTFDLTVVSTDPNPVVADGKSTCTLVVELRDGRGEPVEGHNIFVFVTEGGGNFTQQRNTTDENGQIVLNFRPLRATRYQPATDVTVKFYDESNFIFFLIPKTIYHVIEVVEP